MLHPIVAPSLPPVSPPLYLSISPLTTPSSAPPRIGWARPPRLLLGSSSGRERGSEKEILMQKKNYCSLLEAKKKYISDSQK